MSLSYHFSFSAPSSTSASELEKFLRSVEAEAKKMGFTPTLVLNAEFSTDEQKRFARRLTTGYRIEDERLKGLMLLDENQVWSYDSTHGSCRLIPERGVVLVLTDEHGAETVFGFLAFPKELRDINGRVLVATPCSDSWTFRNFVDSPDPRFRLIVRKFADAGFLESEQDEFA